MLAKSLLPLVLGVANVAAHPVDAPTKTIWTSSTTSTLPSEGIEYIIPKTSQAVEYILPEDDQLTTVAPMSETTATDAYVGFSIWSFTEPHGDGDGPRTQSPKNWLTGSDEEDPLERRCREDPVGFMEEIEFVYSMDEFQSVRDRRPSCFDWEYDKCTHSPDKPFGHNFGPSCQRHDFAWKNFRDRGVYTQYAKDRIESQFYNDMMDVCKSKKFLGKVSCEGSADLYVSAVSIWPANEAYDDYPYGRL